MTYTTRVRPGVFPVELLTKATGSGLSVVHHTYRYSLVTTQEVTSEGTLGSKSHSADHISHFWYARNMTGFISAWAWTHGSPIHICKPCSWVLSYIKNAALAYAGFCGRPILEAVSPTGSKSLYVKAQYENDWSYGHFGTCALGSLISMLEGTPRYLLLRPFSHRTNARSADFLLLHCCSFTPGTNQCFCSVIIICGITLLTHDIEGKVSLDGRPIFLETCQYKTKLRGRQC